jgi:hypothetical protein
MPPKKMIQDIDILHQFESPDFLVVDWNRKKLDILSHAINFFQLPSLRKPSNPSIDEIRTVQEEFWELINKSPQQTKNSQSTSFYPKYMVVSGAVSEKESKLIFNLILLK